MWQTAQIVDKADGTIVGSFVVESPSEAIALARKLYQVENGIPCTCALKVRTVKVWRGRS